MKIAIVGGGLSALNAVFACNANGIIPDVFIKDSPISLGAVYLRIIPDYLQERFRKQKIGTSFIGTREAYILKQWGEVPDGYRSSFPEKNFEEYAYDPKPILEFVFLDRRLMKRINIDEKMQNNDLEYLSKLYDFVFYTFPLKSTLEQISSAVRRIPTVLFEGTSIDLPNKIIYNGDSESFLVRKSIIFGNEVLELSSRMEFTRRELETLFPNSKILFQMDLAPHVSEIKISLERIADNVIPIGRYARVDRSSLAHDAGSIVHETINHVKSI
jgi:hypothetical protein